MENVKTRTCGYRNCGKDISNMRKDAKFCCRQHKSNESTYLKRGAQFIEKYKNEASKRIELIKYLRSL